MYVCLFVLENLDNVFKGSIVLPVIKRKATFDDKMSVDVYILCHITGKREVNRKAMIRT